MFKKKKRSIDFNGNLQNLKTYMDKIENYKKNWTHKNMKVDISNNHFEKPKWQSENNSSTF